MEKNIGLLKKSGIKGQKKEQRTEEWEIEIKYFCVLITLSPTYCLKIMTPGI